MSPILSSFSNIINNGISFKRHYLSGSALSDTWSIVSTGNYSAPRVENIFFTSDNNILFTAANNFAEVDSFGTTVYVKSFSHGGTYSPISFNGSYLVLGTSNNYDSSWQISLPISRNQSNGSYTYYGGSGYRGSMGVHIDSSGNIYRTANANSNNFNTLAAICELHKFNSSGTLQFSKRLSGTGTSNYYSFGGLNVDSSGNVYVSTFHYNGSNNSMISKYNSSGTIQWRYKYGPGSSLSKPFIDSSGNVYFGCTESVGEESSNTVFLIKINPSGTILWQKKYTSNDATIWKSFTPRITDIDPSGNLYGIFPWRTRGNAPGNTFAKLDSSGNILWCGSVSDSGSSSITDFKVSGNYFVACGGFNYGYGFWIYKGYSDGTIPGGTGIYGENSNFTYTNSKYLYTNIAGTTGGPFSYSITDTAAETLTSGSGTINTGSLPGNATNYYLKK